MVDPRIIVAHARNTGKLKLDSGDAFGYYGGHILFGPLVLDVLCAVKSEYLYENGRFLIIVNILCAAIVGCIFLYRREKLKFTVIETGLSMEESREMVREAAEYYDWEIVVAQPDIIVADDYRLIDKNFDPPIVYGAYIGQRITVVFDRGKIYVNSIVNESRQSRTRERGSTSAEIMDIIREEISAKESLSGKKR
jgi:hypothetical protein